LSFTNKQEWKLFLRGLRIAEVKRKVFTLLGNKCKKCGQSNRMILQLDHVNGNGDHKRARDEPYWLAILKEIEAGSKDYQLLCCNCNFLKAFENHERAPKKYPQVPSVKEFESMLDSWSVNEIKALCYLPFVVC
jgi:hypothetical protein